MQRNSTYYTLHDVCSWKSVIKLFRNLREIITDILTFMFNLIQSSLFIHVQDSSKSVPVIMVTTAVVRMFLMVYMYTTYNMIVAVPVSYSCIQLPVQNL
jgi:hypothetical protein